MEATDSAPEPRTCQQCHGIILEEDTFCGHCGKEQAASIRNTREDVFTIIGPTLLYYFITLLLLATYKFTTAFPEGLEGMVVVSIMDVLIVIAFWIHSYREIKPLFSWSNVKLSITFLTVVGAIIGSAVVSIIANVINLSINDDTFYSTYLFEDTSHPFLFATLFIAVQPAIFEEVAFRGFIFNNLKQLSSGIGTVYITGFVFGFMHLQIISLLWLVPIGLVFGLLRNKYNTLWYGVIGHFTYNLFIVAYEFMGWF